MAESNTHRYRTGSLPGGRFAAASTASPSFFFVGDSLEAVKEKADRALALYFEMPVSIRDAERPSEDAPQTQHSRFVPTEEPVN